MMTDYTTLGPTEKLEAALERLQETASAIRVAHVRLGDSLISLAPREDQAPKEHRQEK